MKYLIPLVFLIVACSPIKRFTRLVEKYPYLLTIDSVTIHDTVRVVVPEVHVDTFVKVEALLDTVYLEKDQLKVKVWMKGDNVYIQGQCDTVYVDKIIERKIPVKYYDKTPWWKKLLNNTLAFLIIFAIVYFAFNYLKRITRM
jgi:hypothetical protein